MASRTRTKLAKLKKLRERVLKLGEYLVDDLCPKIYFEEWRDHKHDPTGKAWYDSCMAAVQAKQALDRLIDLLEIKAAILGPPAELPDFGAMTQTEVKAN